MRKTGEDGLISRQVPGAMAHSIRVTCSLSNSGKSPHLALVLQSRAHNLVTRALWRLGQCWQPGMWLHAFVLHIGRKPVGTEWLCTVVSTVNAVSLS